MDRKMREELIQAFNELRNEEDVVSVSVVVNATFLNALHSCTEARIRIVPDENTTLETVALNVLQGAKAAITEMVTHIQEQAEEAREDGIEDGEEEDTEFL